jgi:hypothetical protein
MGNSSNVLLNRVFSQNSLSSLLKDCRNNPYISVVRRYTKKPRGKTNLVLISEIYQYLQDDYRNEYFYKNTLLNQLLTRHCKHSVKNTVALTEIPVGRSRADFILINGKAEVYEIKTELDNFDRLETQLKDYFQAFDHVNVVTCEENLGKIKNILKHSPVGIYILNKKSELEMEKSSRKYTAQLDHGILFKILRKHEYEQVLLQFYPELPRTSQFEYYKTCLKLFKEIDMANLYKICLKELKKRSTIEEQQYLMIPEPLKSLVYFSNPRKSKLEKINTFLNSEFRG